MSESAILLKDTATEAAVVRSAVLTESGCLVTSRLHSMPAVGRCAESFTSLAVVSSVCKLGDGDASFLGGAV